MRSVGPTRWIDLLALCLWNCVRGLDLSPGSLIRLVAPVYGLNDAPLRWHRTLTAWLIKQGYRKSLLEPCLYVHYAPSGSVDGLILIEVDDLAAIGTKRMQEAEFQQRFQAAFRFGKWEKREASYAGRRIRQRDQFVLVDQEKYIMEKLHPVLLRENSRKTGSSHWMTSINSVHLCSRSVGLPRRVVPRLQDLRRFWRNT